jgi:hypothetical protein
MLSQQDILDRLNQLTLHYNLTWRDIKFDADKAVTRINDFLGTIYPPMSEILVSSESTYSYRTGGVDRPFIKDEYIHSVIIPSIATEILARDEEFTTVYNKYLMDIEDGLFNMFQKEFNRVPLAFRQSIEQGVFFASDGALAPVGRTVDANLEAVQFRVYYHLNSDRVIYEDEFFTDTTLYDYQATHTVLTMTHTSLFLAGQAVIAEFTGWSRNQNAPTDLLDPGAEVIVDSDIHLYAHWTYIETLVNDEGSVTIKEDYEDMITDLVIPDRVGGAYVRTIPTDFFSVNLRSVVFPGTLTAIEASAFLNSVVAQIEFQAGTGFEVEIGANAFSNTNISFVVLPTDITDIGTNAFDTADMLINVCFVEGNVPWDSGWYDDDANIEVVYGYNG